MKERNIRSHSLKNRPNRSNSNSNTLAHCKELTKQLWKRRKRSSLRNQRKRKKKRRRKKKKKKIRKVKAIAAMMKTTRHSLSKSHWTFSQSPS